MIEQLLGHTVDGKPVYLWTRTDAWCDRESGLTVGTESIRLDHIAPGLEQALTASLSRESGRVAA